MSNNPPFVIEGSPSEQWNLYRIERATAIAQGPNVHYTTPNYRYLCARCDYIVSTSRIIQSSLSNPGLRYDGGAPENFAHYETFRGLVHSGFRGCHLCNLLHTASLGLPGLSYCLVITWNAPHVQIYVKHGIRNLGEARLPSVQSTQTPIVGSFIQSLHTDSDESFACAGTWLQTCLNRHQVCNINRQLNNYRPRRLLEVSIFNSQLSVMLMTSQRIPWPTQYLTLSHCWGGAEGLSLTQARLLPFSERIPLESLPKTFLDAVVVTARLGYRYLWIDSLCIIQDCPQDRELEINSMGDIYRNSQCTIAALSAQNSDEGCFVPRDPLERNYPQSFDHDFYQRVQDPLALPGPDCIGDHRPPLNTRAWVIQERALSPRTLYYGSMIYWECIQCRAFECRPQLEDYERPDGGRLRQISGKKHAFKRLLEHCRTNSYDDWKYDWRTMVEEYSTCQLSNDDDKWSAFKGLAMEVERNCGERLLGGLWQNHLPGDLLWVASPGPGKALETQELEVPSWSWLSINGRVIWPNPPLANNSNIEWTAAMSLPASSVPSVSPTTNSLIMEAPLVNLAEIFPNDSETGSPGLNPKSEHPNVSSISWFPDTAESIDISSKWALQVSRVTGNLPCTRYYGLVVTEVEDSPSTWERLGYYQITCFHRDFKDSEPPPGFGKTERIILV